MERLQITFFPPKFLPWWKAQTLTAQVFLSATGWLIENSFPTSTIHTASREILRAVNQRCKEKAVARRISRAVHTLLAYPIYKWHWSTANRSQLKHKSLNWRQPPPKEFGFTFKRVFYSYSGRSKPWWKILFPFYQSKLEYYFLQKLHFPSKKFSIEHFWLILKLF